MIDKETINEKLENLKKYVGYLKEYRKFSLEDIKKDYTLQGAIRYYLQIACECVIDICEIIISGLGLPKPDTARDSIEMLGENGILPLEFSLKISKMTGLRNILVHEYAKIDISEIYNHLQKKLDDFSQFAKLIATWINKI
ncbi:DUF86 domain-containing protein [bacterium]|nr:DUF86 domain-containing protein [bacterium]